MKIFSPDRGNKDKDKDKNKNKDKDKEKKKSSKPKYGKIIAREVYDASSTFKNYIPLFGSVFEIMDNIIAAYDCVEINSKICLVLVDRVEIVKASIARLERRYKEDENKFHDENYYKSFLQLKEILKKINKFISDVSDYSYFLKALFRKNIKEECADLLNELDYTCSALQLEIIISEAERKREQKYLSEDLKKDLKKIFEEIIKDKPEYLLSMAQVNEIKKNNIENVERINPSKLNDEDFLGNSTEYRGKVFKKYLNKTISVACSPVNIEMDLDNNNTPEGKKFINNLAILSKLYSSDKIIRFHGISQLNGKYVLIFEWAEKGNLKELYEKEVIPWSAKLKYAKDISEGLLFLRTCEIFHHDVRCENVLITNNDGVLTAKLANFELSRETCNATNQFEDISVVIRWMAPEKIDDMGNPSKANYSFECEVYSFGMLLWELSFQKVPYLDIDLDNIYHHILKGKREQLKFLDGPNDIMDCFKNIIRESWKPDAKQRLKILDIYIKLHSLLSFHTSESGKSPNKNIDVLQSNSNQDDYNKLTIEPVLSIEDGISKLKIEKEKDKKDRNPEELKKIWRGLEFYSSIDNLDALYWKAIYLDTIEKDKKQAFNIYKEAALKGHTEAQCRYAQLLINEKDPKLNSEIVFYLKSSAEKGYLVSLYLYGKIIYEGKFGLSEDHTNGLTFLKLAALKNHPLALKFLKELNESYI
ncbi:hypothetical protein Glove_115g31 [Diversispora epigaea]|uniref:Protein kinase domain-containing protein n=1 Tax=Diversispora epigaea TaxID=1348612 RepID=A0A397J5J2_9GLOM|nr:hypothetical protein Glove_115g31 [Diversispora epigaea]